MIKTFIIKFNRLKIMPKFTIFIWFVTFLISVYNSLTNNDNIMTYKIFYPILVFLLILSVIKFEFYKDEKEIKEWEYLQTQIKKP